MKKSNSEVLLDPTPTNRRTPLPRDPSLKSTITHFNDSHHKLKTPGKPHLSAHPCFKIDTQRLLFYGQGEKMTQTVTIQNVGKEMLRISLSLPRTKYFLLSEDSRAFSLPAGMSRKVMIELASLMNFSDDAYCDEIIVQTENSRDRISLEWFAHKPSLKYTPLMDLGAIDVGRQHRIALQLENDSKDHSLKVRLVKDAWDNIQIAPDEFSIGPQKKVNVEVVVYPQTTGAYHHKVVVEAEERLLHPIEITYAAIDFAFRIENEKQEAVKSVDFGTLLRGTRKQMILWAHNNSPSEVDLKSKIKIGKTLKAQSTLQSPQELGEECSSTVIELQAKSLRIPPFSRKKLVLTTQTRVEERHRLLVDRFARTEGLTAPLRAKLLQEESDHHQILVCQFVENRRQGQAVPVTGNKNVIITPMHAKFTLPLLRLIPNSLSFGQLPVGGTLQATVGVENISNEVGCTLSMGKLFSCDLFLLRQTLAPKEGTQLEVYLRGTNIGACRSQMELIVADTYPIHIPIDYQVTSLREKEERLHRTGFSSSHFSNTASLETMDFNRTLLQTQAEQHRGKYEKTNFRKGTAKSKPSQSLLHRTEVRDSRNSKDEERLEVEGEVSCALPARRELTPARKYNLFVTKKIDKYLPYEELRQQKKLLKTRNTRDYFSSNVRRVPKNRKEGEEVARELTPEELKLISISEKIMNFGRVFIKSKAERQFVIGNSTEGALLVQLYPADPKKHPFLSETDFQPQIVPVGGAARLKVVFSAQSCGKFESTLSYSINGAHCFQLLVEAEVQWVSLAISKTSLRMAYLDDISEILLKDSFVLKNEGNTPASFTITQPATKFLIDPPSATINPGDSLTVWVTENNQNYPVIQAGQTFPVRPPKTASSLPQDRILIKITDGNDISLKVGAAGVCQARCVVKESRISFGATMVSKPKSRSFQLKNLSRSLCLFEIFNDECAEFLSFDCIKGRIPPEGTKEITATYRSTLLHALHSNFQILIRGGLIINVPISAESVAPQVSIVEHDFAFGEVCCDTAAVRPINVRNDSETPVELFADLRSRERGVEHLMISLWGSQTTPLAQKPKSPTRTYRAVSLQEQIVENALHEQSVHRIRVEARSVLTFHLVFKPTAPGYYQFMLPVFLQNFIRNECLSKVVSCSAIEPRFVVEPSVIRFKKKIISDKESSCFHPFVEFLTIRNPTDRLLKWKLDLHGTQKTTTSFSSYSSNPHSNTSYRKDLLPKLCFEVEEKKGELRARESVSVKVSFNPLEEGFYCHKLPLLIFSEERGTYHQQAEIRLEGEGKYPSLYFNRRQLIMPVVPIGIESIAMLQVHNEGYESIDLKHRFQILDSQGNLHVSKGNLTGDAAFPEIVAVFPEGCKMSLNKRQLFVILKFTAKRSMSFTCKLELYDEATDCRAYSLPVSGTADNSLLTTFAYLSDPQNIYRLDPDHPPVDSRTTAKPPKAPLDDRPILSVTLRTNDGRNLVDRYHSIYDDLTVESFALDCRILKRWLNSFFREERVRQFPTDLSQNGQLLLKLLLRLTGRKEFEGSWEYEGESGREVLDGRTCGLGFYESILRVLKTMGCLLNHIRPYYLLERDEFVAFMGKDSNWRIYADYYLKRYDLIYHEAWIVLLYQLIQHFWCSRPRPDPARSASNVYSPAELQVLRWVKGIYEQFHPLEDSKEKFLSFGNDYKDCVAPVFCLLKYSVPPKNKSAQSLIRKPIAPQEFANNTKLLYQMLERLNIAPIIYEDEYQLCKEKEIFLFMHHLFEVLPQTAPRLPPLLFPCQLGETCSRVIDIRNPSNRIVHYWVKLQGCKDFTFQEKESIIIEPKSTYPFTVQYKSRLSSEQVAYISFFSKQQAEPNSVNGCALVFELRSRVTGRKSIKKLEPISCPLYDTLSFKVLVENIFEDHELGNFSIHIREEPLDMPFLPTNNKTETEHYDPLALLEQHAQPSKPTQFYCETEGLKIKKGGASSFDLYFMPLKLGRTRCLLIFNDPAVGEFQYQVVGTGETPKPLQEIKYQPSLFVGSKEALELSLPVYNSHMLKCESYFEQRAPPHPHKDRPEDKYRFQLNMDPKIAEYISFPTEVTLKSPKKDGIDMQNRIRLEYNFPHIIKDLTLDFMLVGDARRDIQDVRRFRVGLTVAHRPLLQELVMTTTARKPLCQPIPLDNTSSKDWKVKATILQNENGWLSLKEGQKVSARELVVKKGQSQTIPICFDPKSTGRATGRVVIYNQTTNEQLFFAIRGIAEDPLSQNHFHLKMNNEGSTNFTVSIANPHHERLTYRVVSDIEELLLPSQITLQADQQTQFNFVAQSIDTSPVIGYIKFIDPEGRFFWYSLTLECSERKLREFWVEMTAEVGKEIQKSVEFKNPFNRQLFFKVELPKEISLEAKEEFVINPQDTHQYKIKFRPFRPIATEVTLKAVSKDIGSFLYHIKLTAKEELRRRVYAISVEVGKSGTLDLRLQNPFRTPIKVTYMLSNPAFSVESSDTLLSGENVCRLRFKPASEGKEVCTVKVWGEHFPTRMFEVQGTGIAPYTVDTINFHAHPNENSLEIIKFPNPNPKRANQVARVCLSEVEHGCFRIVGHQQTTWETEVGELLVIPVEFQPREKGSFESVLTVQYFNFQWKYLLKGSTSFKEGEERPTETLTATCKQQVVRLLNIPMPEYLQQPPCYFDRVELEHPDKKLAKLLRSWMKLKLNNVLPQEEESEQQRQITVYLKFRPKKQMKETVKLVLFSGAEQGPKIHFNLQLKVLDCGPENVIPLQITSIKGIHFDIGVAGLGLKEISIKKVSMGKGTYCEAEILPEHIRLKFKPNHLIFNRSRVYCDNLLLESEEEQWNYEVQFTHKK